MRACDRCEAKMALGRPRVRRGRQLWCQSCAKNYGAPGKYSPGTDIATQSLLEADMNTKIALTANLTGQRIIVVAHDSGDGQTIYHCPFCGSGQVIARSDKTIECEFCHTSFTVQVQPEYSAFPQTMDGQPVQVPGMPGQIDQPVGGGPQDPQAPGAPDASVGDADQDGLPDAQDPDANGDGFDDANPASADNQPPWLKSGLRTQAGKVLPLDEYVRHLAIKHAEEDERPAVLRTVRASRGL